MLYINLKKYKGVFIRVKRGSNFSDKCLVISDFLGLRECERKLREESIREFMLELREERDRMISSLLLSK